MPEAGPGETGTPTIGRDAAVDAGAEAKPRYTQVEVATTKATEEREPDRVLADDEALELGRWYAVSVWIDTERRGVPPENVEHPIEEPGATQRQCASSCSRRAVTSKSTSPCRR